MSSLTCPAMAHRLRSRRDPSFPLPAKQVGTPDSLDSLDIPSSASDGGCEIFSPSAVSTPGGQLRALDSGYDTENYRSPSSYSRRRMSPVSPRPLGSWPQGESPGGPELSSLPP